MINNLNITNLNKWLEDENILLIDVREKEEYESGFIANAINIPLSQIISNQYNLPKTDNKKIVLYCHLGQRSMSACHKLKQDGIEQDLWNLEGGISAWKNQALPIGSI